MYIYILYFMFTVVTFGTRGIKSPRRRTLRPSRCPPKCSTRTVTACCTCPTSN